MSKGLDRLRRRELVPLLVLVVSLLLSAAATAAVGWMSRSRDATRFDHAVDGAEDRITARLSAYVTLLRGGAALISASDEVTEAEFRRYVEQVRLPELYPGIQGIGYSARLTPAIRDSLVAARRSGGVPGFRVWPEGAPGEEEHTIAYLFPLDRRNRAAIGFNMYSESIRREAMERARDTGQAAMSGKVTLVQEIEGRSQAGFLVYNPVYGGGAAPTTVEGRRAGLRGFVYAPFRGDDLFAGIFGSEVRPHVAFRVYDGTRPSAASLLHDSAVQGVVPARDPRFERRDTLRVAGRLWTVDLASTPAFESQSRRGVWVVMLVLGVAGSVVLFFVTRRQVAARDDAEALALRLQETNRQLVRLRREADLARDEANHANRAKSEFLAAMSHELRTPLNAIMGYAELMDMGIHGPVTPQQRHALERIRRSQAHLLGLIDDLLSYAKLEAGKVEVRREAVPLARVLADLEVMTEPQVRDRGLVATFRPGADPVTAWGDPDRIRQVLLNLLTNAIKFTPPGGEIRVECDTGGDHALVRVADTGEGIAADRLGVIFDPFIQVDRTGERDGLYGVGLGLAISRDLTRLMEGELSVESELGVGSVFTLRLPRAAAAPAGSRAEGGTTSLSAASLRH